MAVVACHQANDRPLAMVAAIGVPLLRPSFVKLAVASGAKTLNGKSLAEEPRLYLKEITGYWILFLVSNLYMIYTLETIEFPLPLSLAS